MRFIFLLFLILYSLEITAQNIPINPNQYNENGKKIGNWTIFFDKEWNKTNSIKKTKYYRLITYENGIPKGKVFDYYLDGKIQWEGFLLSDEPEDFFDGECIFYAEDGDGFIKENYKDGMLNGLKSIFDSSGNLLLTIEYNDDNLVNHEIINIPEDSKYKTRIENWLWEIHYHYDSLGNYDSGLEVALELLDLGKSLYNEKDPRFISIQDNLYDAYISKSLFKKGLELILEIQKKEREVFGEDSEEYIQTLALVASSYSDLSNYPKAIEIGKIAAEKMKNYYGDNSDEYAYSVNNLALSFSYLGDDPKALEMELISLEIRKNIFGNNSVEYASALENLSMTYANLGDYNKALELNLESHKIKRKIYGENNRYYALSLYHLGTHNESLENYSKSKEYFTSAREIYEKIGTENIYYPMVLSGLSSIYSHEENYNKAFELALKAYEISKKIHGEIHDEIAISLSNLSYKYQDLDSIDKALDFLWKSVDVIEILYGRESFKYHEQTSRIAEFYWTHGYWDESLHQFASSVNYYIKRYLNYENQMNEGLMQEINFELLEKLHYLFDLAPDSKITYNLWNFLKSRELSKRKSLSDDVYNSKDSTIINDYNQWIAINRSINVWYEKTPQEREKLNIGLSQLLEEADKLERLIKRKLSNKVDDYTSENLIAKLDPENADPYFNISNSKQLIGDWEGQIKDRIKAMEIDQSNLFSSNNIYSFNDIISRLEQGEVYIDIIKGLFEEPDLPLGEESYFAYVIKKGDKKPKVVYLNSEVILNRAFSLLNNHIYKKENPSKGGIYYDVLWNELNPYIENVSTVYFSPEGVYSKINPNVLYNTKTGNFVEDELKIIYSLNVEDFVYQKDMIKNEKFLDKTDAVLIGNPKFLLNSDEKETVLSNAKTREINQIESKNMRGTIINDLPGTEIEINEISNILSNNGWNTVVFSGSDANEINVKNIQNPTVLHIATHGYFFDNQKEENPLLQSGLLFSGAENTKKGELIGEENGWFNSLEASLLSLKGTELVVLSACETGGGNVMNGKGVYGLQRAIQIAGAKSIIMSMWKVDDNATKDLMISFYNNWINNKMSKRDSFLEAKKDIRKKYIHPYYWGSFIMIGS